MKKSTQKTWHISLKPLCQALNYTFSNTTHLHTALTHRSVGMPNNERLEFLGDAILGYLIADALFLRFPEASEGSLTRLRSNLVKGETLADIARDIKLGSSIALGPGEMKSGGWRRQSILADVLEAIIGAVYVDSDIEQCKTVILHLFKQRLKDVSLDDVLKDPKTRLQEFLQSRRKNLPEYRLVKVEGNDHARYFTIECHVIGLSKPTIGAGESRRRAEQIAAEKALKLLTLPKQEN